MKCSWSCVSAASLYNRLINCAVLSGASFVSSFLWHCDWDDTAADRRPPSARAVSRSDAFHLHILAKFNRHSSRMHGHAREFFYSRMGLTPHVTSDSFNTRTDWRLWQITVQDKATGLKMVIHAGLVFRSLPKSNSNSSLIHKADFGSHVRVEKIPDDWRGPSEPVEHPLASALLLDRLPFGSPLAVP